MGEWNSQSDGIEQSISKHRRCKKPRPHAIERPRRERPPVKSGAPFLKPKHLLPYALAEIRRERHPLSAISHAVVDAVVLTQMWQCIESVRDPPHPCVSNAHGFQLWKYLLHHLPKPRHAGERVLLGQS